MGEGYPKAAPDRGPLLADYSPPSAAANWAWAAPASDMGNRDHLCEKRTLKTP